MFCYGLHCASLRRAVNSAALSWILTRSLLPEIDTNISFSSLLFASQLQSPHSPGISFRCTHRSVEWWGRPVKAAGLVIVMLRSFGDFSRLSITQGFALPRDEDCRWLLLSSIKNDTLNGALFWRLWWKSTKHFLFGKYINAVFSNYNNTLFQSKQIIVHLFVKFQSFNFIFPLIFIQQPQNKALIKLIIFQ